MKFQDDISNMNTYIHTYIYTDKPKPIFPSLFQSWGHKDNKFGLMHEDALFGLVLSISFLIFFPTIQYLNLKTEYRISEKESKYGIMYALDVNGKVCHNITVLHP